MINSDVTKRCNLINPPENPYRNLLYTGIYYRNLLHTVAGVRYVAGKDFIETSKGLEEVHPNESFEPGGRLGQHGTIKKLQSLGLSKPDVHAVVRAMVMLSYNAGPGKAPEYFNTYLDKRIREKRMLKPTDVDFLVTDFFEKWSKITGGRAKKNPVGGALGEARRVGHTKSLPEYLMVIQDSGAAGYITRVAEKHKELIKLMGDDRCVSDNFIHF